MIASFQTASAVGVSEFYESQVPGDYILEAEKGSWTWGMAPIYDEAGRLHVFNSVIPEDGSWIKHSKIVHWVADSIEGPYTLLGDVFASEEASYHNPQISKVGDTYVLVYLLNRHSDGNGSRQEVGIATAKSLNGPWTESPHNPVIAASGKMGGYNIVHASNPSFVVTPEGQYRIYFKSMIDQLPIKQAFREISFAVSEQIEGPYVNYEGNPVISYVDEQVDIEDPYAFYYKGMYYMIVEDRRGVKNMLEGNPIPQEKIKNGGYRPGLIYQSVDGIDWGRPMVGYKTNESYFGDPLARSERPSILWKDGEPEYLFLSCHDDKPSAGYYIKIDAWTGESMSQ
ncbi:glycoside hydrolase family protein [Coraliomargarita sp. SDUM461003]|uniref:Glycoside hydrolase family protein n=1 Tax=Thalassobacterium maritimum TaxID=3041265 RepID=A0ABU1ATQ9_9BACT|nr:glycoside hydrolase family protein [Coraliomargarita sp. SDUM461003]MDQ8207540.1 glycoside hydrolase family protein [Coraliomargarita sp. SDUM461003]